MTATLTLNNNLNGIEISFEAKPSATILNALKEMGFRWHRAKQLWYAKSTPERMELAKSLAGGEYEEAAGSRKKEAVNICGVEVGDVFVDSWGYEQTNIDFYQVVALK